MCNDGKNYFAESYLKSIDFTTKEFTTTNKINESLKFDIPTLKQNIVRIKGIILDSDNVSGMYIASECLYDESVEYLNDSFGLYRWYYLSNYGVFPSWNESSYSDIKFTNIDTGESKIITNTQDRNYVSYEEELYEAMKSLCTIESNMPENIDMNSVLEQVVTDIKDEKKENKKPKKTKEELTIEKNKNIITPREIANKLSEKVIGQDKAIKKMSIVAYNHLLMINNRSKNFHKMTPLLIGASGSGKTYICQVLSEIIDVPYAIVNAAELTSSGYKGADVIDVFIRLYNECDGNLDKINHSIIVYDEIDKKILRKTNFKDGQQDVSGGVVVDEILKLIEGTKVEIEVRVHGRIEKVQIDTSQITFVFAGACKGIVDQLKEKEMNKLNSDSRIGIGGKPKKNY